MLCVKYMSQPAGLMACVAPPSVAEAACSVLHPLVQVRYMLQSAGRLAEVPQILINPSEDALFNLMSSCAKKEDIEVRLDRGLSVSHHL
jgi:hypothetical protein